MVVTTALLGTGACGAQDRAPEAGHYAIATPDAAVDAVPTALPGRPAVVAAGSRVRVQLPGVDAMAELSGPDMTLPSPVPGRAVTNESAPGVLTVTLDAASGTVDVPAASFVGLDEQRRPMALSADQERVTATPGHPATVHLSGTFRTGDTLLTWQPTGQPAVTWDFAVEID